MASFEPIVPYFTSPLPLLAIGCTYALILALTILFHEKRHDPIRRSDLLLGMFFLTFFVWSFIGASFALSYFYSNRLSFASLSIQSLVGLSLLAALYVTIPLTVLLYKIGPKFMLRKIEKQFSLRQPNDMVAQKFEAIAKRMNMEAELQVANVDAPVSFAIAGKRKMIVLSEQLMKLLDINELEAVIAHELAHLKRGPSKIKLLAATYRSIITFDPLIRLIEAAIYRESEYMADQASALVTGKPMALVSALLKIYDEFLKGASLQSSFLDAVRGKNGVLCKHPPLRSRIDRLLKMADLTLSNAG